MPSVWTAGIRLFVYNMLRKILVRTNVVFFLDYDFQKHSLWLKPWGGGETLLNKKDEIFLS